MKAAKKFFTGVSLIMIAIFVFESIYNWNESRDSFMKAYNEGINNGSALVKK
jgi:hypothetical protein